MWKMTLLHGLILAGVFLCLPAGKCLESGCEAWDSGKEPDHFCCIRCKPGNHLKTKCGRKPQDLCSPCEKDKFVREALEWSCKRCSTCTGIMRVKENCTASSDTVCECKDGFRCSDEECSSCFRECPKGKQPRNRECEPCPPGTFNDKIHHPCINWTKCPQAESDVITPGSVYSDVICRDMKKTTAGLNQKPNTEPSIHMITGISIIFALICISITLHSVLMVTRRRRSWCVEEKDGFPAVEMAEASRAEENSFCFPHQEEGSDGGSSQSSQYSLISPEPRTLQAGDACCSSLGHQLLLASKVSH
ncbi:hypothetical protein DNTS_009336 [Danionella cerebrum]|uniref:TNFR-Cys domain-containing protein n=1 Tax=Danionella cerebrum TaxID=2873325 RepID=A0A553QCJ5_9TELE|nr:hypothetical protein DNTS_009336 [Danionella translucida]